jgi:hypothetical protein
MSAAAHRFGVGLVRTRLSCCAVLRWINAALPLSSNTRRVKCCVFVCSACAAQPQQRTRDAPIAARMADALGGYQALRRAVHSSAPQVRALCGSTADATQTCGCTFGCTTDCGGTTE